MKSLIASTAPFRPEPDVSRGRGKSRGRGRGRSSRSAAGRAANTVSTHQGVEVNFPIRGTRSVGEAFNRIT